MRPRLSTAFVHTFWDVFDHLGFCFAVNFFCFLSLATGVLYPVAMTGALGVHRRWIEGKEPRVRDYFLVCRDIFRPAFLLGLLHFAFVAVCAANFYFYWTHFEMLGKFLAAGVVLISVFWKTILFFSFPLILLGNRLGKALQLGFFLAIKHIGFVLLFFLMTAGMVFLLVMSVVAIPLLLFSVVFVFWGNAFDQVRRSEENLPPRPLPEKTFKELFFPFQT